MSLDVNTGNLKLVDAKDKFPWQSLRFPTNTWLPGQRLRLHTHLTSTVRASNLSTGMFFITLLQTNLGLYVNLGTPRRYQSMGIQGGKKFKFSGNRIVFHVSNNGMHYKTHGPHFLYLRLEPNGQLNVYRIAPDGEPEIFHLAEDKKYGKCIYPTNCGNYGVCSDDICSCPGDSIYFKQLNGMENGFGFSYAEITPLSCQDMKLHTCIKLDGVTYFGFVPHLNNITDVECKTACLRNCSCKAAFFQYGGNLSLGNCFLPTELYSLRRSKEMDFQYDAFIKVQMPSHKKKSPQLLLVTLPVSAFLVLFIGASCRYIRWRNKKITQVHRRENSNDESSLHVTNILRKFSLEDLRSATQNF
ncbi:G-type lectin S-receptor-like serine/threonine-protein kinase At5g35370 [Pistacia vera]|uniref:G-type lectin S-receptor-like serine/threonine-protein kinase At5g35370 n=1 Tax=Pistacia vera TaxID=55513 RepID=UPI001263AFC6|nr:G-type lectin S-receptor-like serine/threonine-protein kinase At5g35370 [Pistacia vera]